MIYKSPYSVENALNNQNAQIANVSYLKIKYHLQKYALVVEIKPFLIASGVVVMLKNENRCLGATTEGFPELLLLLVLCPRKKCSNKSAKVNPKKD